MPRRRRIYPPDRLMMYYLHTKGAVPIGTLASMFKVTIVYTYRVIAQMRRSPQCTDADCALADACLRTVRSFVA